MSKTNLTYVLTFLSGLLLGWLALGWWLWPVAYVGEANTYELNQADKLRYASAVVDSYAATGQADLAWFALWTPEEVHQAMAQVVQRNPAKANWAWGLANQASAAQPVQVKAQDQAKDAVGLDWSLPVEGVIGFAILAGCGVFLILRRQSKVGPNPLESFAQPQKYSELKIVDYIPTQAVPTRTLAHASLTFGPDQPTDQHFPIDSQQEGEPSPGEFGVNQVDDQPAWDVWLFDKQALVTVTKVLADQGSEELASRGELLNWKEPFTLETPNLKMTGTAVKLLEDGLRVDLAVEAKEE